MWWEDSDGHTRRTQECRAMAAESDEPCYYMECLEWSEEFRWRRHYEEAQRYITARLAERDRNRKDGDP